MNLCLLAGNALTSPTGTILAEGRPDELVGDCLSRPFDARMTKFVDRREYASSPVEWDVGTSRTIRNVDD